MEKFLTKAERRADYKAAKDFLTYTPHKILDEYTLMAVCLILGDMRWGDYAQSPITYYTGLKKWYPEFAAQKPMNALVWWPCTPEGVQKRIEALERAIALTYK